MNFFQSVAIGIVQGIGEFLPISSSGHLVLMYQLFNIKENTVLLSIFLHIATLFSVLYAYRVEIIKLIKNPFCKTNKLLFISTIPTVFIAILLKGLINSSFENNFVIFGFLITAVVLGVADYVSENSKIITSKAITMPSGNNFYSSSTLMLNNKNDVIVKKNNIINDNDITDINLSYFQAIAMGVTQGLACFPGISRSGSTIATGLILKGDKNQVTTFSFLLSIPVIIGSLIFALFEVNESSLRIDTFSLIISCIVSFLIGIVSIKLIKSVVKKQKLSYFSFYLIGLVFLILFIKWIA